MLVYDLGIAIDGTGLIATADDLAEPALKKLRDGATLRRQVGARRLRILGSLEFSTTSRRVAL
jgi:hypothetical protein